MRVSLGLFDSGLGGLTVLRRLRELLPEQDVLFFADQAHAPYGDRSTAELLRLMQHNVAWLDAAGPQIVVMACNTSCAIAAQFGWPPTRAVVLDLIESAAIAAQQGGYRRIGVVATTATARSGAYGRAIAARIPGAAVYEVAAPELVPLVEAGKLHGDEPREAVARACAQLPGDLDAVLLACTHYPLLAGHFAGALPGAVVVDPAIAHAQRTAELVERLDLPPGTGALICVTNGDLERFRENVGALIGDLHPEIRHLAHA